MVKQLTQVIAGISLSLFSLSATAQENIEATSVGGKQLRLSFSSAVTTNVHEAKLCSNPQAQLSELKLWMPSMGHGSSPVRLSTLSDGCYKVERIQFLMSGTWELLLKFRDRDTAVITVEVTD